MIPKITFDSKNGYDKEIVFDVEIAKDDEPQYRGVGKETLGGDGKISHFALDYVLEEKTIALKYMSPIIRNQLEYFAKEFACVGDRFRYYPDKDDSTRYFTVKLTGNKKTIRFSRTHPHIVEFDAKMAVRVIEVSAQIQADRESVYP